MGKRYFIIAVLVLAFVLSFNTMEWRNDKAEVLAETRIEFYNYTYIVYERALLVNKVGRVVREYVYVSIPRNTSRVYCKVLKVEPEPLRFETDEEGNIFALIFVEVKPGEELWINLTYTIRVSGYKIYFEKDKALWPPLEIARTYTDDSIYWNIDNETLRNLAYEVAYSDNPLETAEKIAKWVQDHLMYEITGVRKGSDHAIVRKGLGLAVRGDCVEVADTYVTMARILGLPARTVFGFLLTTHEEKHWLNTSLQEGMNLLTHWGGHMWVQVYVPPWGWIDVEMLEDLSRPKIGDFTNLHVPFGVEGKTFYGSGLLEFIIPSYLELEYIEFDFKRGE